MSTLPIIDGNKKITTVVIKSGSRIITPEDSTDASKRIRNLVSDIVYLRKSGIRVVFVSSGAIAWGMLALGLKKRPVSIPMQQACASIGQIRLMHMYESLFKRRNVRVGQVLLTWDDLRAKKRYLNLRNSLFQLIDADAVPVINENDSVGIDEIRFGDNDTLGAQVAMLVGADVYINLTDINGLYNANPRNCGNARHIPIVEKITPSIMKHACSRGTAQGVGGMVTKLKAAQMVTKAGIYAVIGDGYHKRLRDIVSDSAFSTLFLPSEKRMSSKRRWIAFTGKTTGSIVVDEGAKNMLINKGKSLLAVGITDVKGVFRMGDMVNIRDGKGRCFARGMTNYSSNDVSKIRGSKSNNIESILGEKSFNEVVHRDNLVIL